MSCFFSKDPAGPILLVGPMGSTPSFMNLSGHGTGTAYNNAFSYGQNAPAILASSFADTTFARVESIDANATENTFCDERCDGLPSADITDCKTACGVLRY